MNITLFGTGNMGRGIGTKLIAGGNTLTLMERDPEAAQNLASELRGSAKDGSNVKVARLEEGIQDDVVILAVWYPVNLEIAQHHQAELAGKTVVDIANPLNESFDGPSTEPGSSSAEELAAVLPESRVVKAFNTTFAGTLVQGEVAGQPLDVFIAGDDVAAKNVVAELVRSGGLTAVDVGPLQRARQLEGLGFLGIQLQSPLGTGFMSGWRLVH